MTTKNKLPFKIGADPEFLLFHGVRALDAHGLMTTYFQKKANLKLNETGHGGGYIVPNVGEIGWDGASSTGELRPEPTDNPEEMVNKIGTLIAKMHEHMPFVDYTTLSIGSPIGGHIILDAPKELVSENHAPNGDIQAQKAEMNRVAKLIASFVMPIIASEHKVSSSSRLGMDYGQADDYRWEERGPKKQGTLEVRGMSAEWITSPKIAHATLCYMAVIWHEILKNNKELIKEKAILKTKGHITAVQQMMLADYRLLETAIVKGLSKLIRQFELYPLYKKEVEFILHPADAMREKEKHGWNLTSGWKIGNKVKPPTRKDIFADKKIAERLKAADMAALEQGFHVPYNDDYNVQLYAKAISDRVAGINWKLNNEYFLFGLKKGIEGFACMRIKEKTFHSVPTNNPHANTTSSCEKMSKRFEEEIKNLVRIDPKTGKTRRWGVNQVVIGIPYGIRAENNTKPLLELIWDIEKGKNKATKITEFVDGSIQEKEPAMNATAAIEENLKQNTDFYVPGTRQGNEIQLEPTLVQNLNETPAT